MFNVRSIVVTLLAIICGGIAVMGAQGLVASKSGGAPAARMVQVIVPKRDLDRGELLEETAIEVVQWPEAAASKYMIRERKSAQGRRAKVALVAGEPLLDGKLAARGEFLSPGGLIGEGMRAMCIQFQTPAAAMAGLIYPKDRVDLYVADRVGGANPSTKSRLLLGNVEVFAIGDQVSMRKAKEGEKSKDIQTTSVTFHVSIQDAAILDAARADGQLSIGLRNPKDKEVAVQVADSTAPNLEPVQPASSVAPVKPKARKTVVKPAVSKPMLFLRGNDSQLMTHSWTSGR